MAHLSIICIIFFNLGTSEIVTNEELACVFPEFDLEEIQVVKVFRTRVLVESGDQESFVKLGQSISNEAWILKYCHPTRVILQSKDESQIRIYVKQKSGEYSLQAYQPLIGKEK